MFELRWHVVKNKVTVDDVKRYQQEHGTSSMESKRILENKEQRLEYRSSPETEWIPVPVVVTELDVQKDN